jgi:hypothetical protein
LSVTTNIDSYFKGLNTKLQDKLNMVNQKGK